MGAINNNEASRALTDSSLVLVVFAPRYQEVIWKEHLIKRSTYLLLVSMFFMYIKIIIITKI